MGGNLLKNVFIDVAGKCSFFDMGALGEAYRLSQRFGKTTRVQDDISDQS